MNFKEHYRDDQLFKPIFKALDGEWPKENVQKEKIMRLLHLVRKEGGLLFYKTKICVPRTQVRDLLYQAHDTRVSGHFTTTKTLARLEKHHWKGKSRDVKKYCEGCMTCQQQNDYHTQKKFTDPTPLNIPLRRWGSLASDFIVKLPKTKNGYDSITTWVDRLSRVFISSHPGLMTVQLMSQKHSFRVSSDTTDFLTAL